MPRNTIVLQRLKGILGTLLAAHGGGQNLSSSSKGTEREAFVKLVLESVIAPPFRIGNGDVTDSAGNRTGQLDIVLEYTNSLSLPIGGSEFPRLYLAEGVCAIFEVKSDLTKQWAAVVASHSRVAPITRSYGSNIVVGTPIPKQIPHFAVGYNGWTNISTLKNHLAESGLQGILTLQPALYASVSPCEGWEAGALFAFLVDVENLAGSMVGARPIYSNYT